MGLLAWLPLIFTELCGLGRVRMIRLPVCGLLGIKGINFPLKDASKQQSRFFVFCLDPMKLKSYLAYSLVDFKLAYTPPIHKEKGGGALRALLSLYLFCM